MSRLDLAAAGLAFPGLFILAGVSIALRKLRPPVRFRTIASFLGLGVASLVLTLVWNLFAEGWALGRVSPAFSYAFLTAAIPEEGFRYLAIRLGLGRKPRYGPVAAMLLGSLAGLALGAIENAGYWVDRGWAVGLARSVTSVPYHTLAGAALAGGIALSAGTGRPWGLAALVVLVIVHGLGDWPAGGPESALPDNPLGEFVARGWAGNIASLVAAIVFTIVLARAARRAESV
jgi:hypothetical protein